MTKDWAKSCRKVNNFIANIDTTTQGIQDLTWWNVLFNVLTA